MSLYENQKNFTFIKPHKEKTSLPLKLDFQTICIDLVGVYDIRVSCVGYTYFAG